MTLATIVGRRAMMRCVARSATAAANRSAAAGVTAVGSTAGPTMMVNQQLQQSSCFSTLGGGELLTQMAKENPYKDVVRYEHKNRKWNLHHVDFYSEGLAIGLLENGLQPGDVVLSWLPPHFSESVCI